MGAGKPTGLRVQVRVEVGQPAVQIAQLHLVLRSRSVVACSR